MVKPEKDVDLEPSAVDTRSPSRRRLPALVVITALAAAAAAGWADVLSVEESVTSRVTCPAAPAAAGLTPLPYRALRDVDPLPPAEVAVRVRNSTDRRGLAGRVAARLDLMGFAEAAPPDNDPVYPTGAARCVGQIRFGPEGRSAARTLSLAAPCAQLIRDGRSGTAVDLVVGTEFLALSPGSAAREVLDFLREQHAAEEQTAGGLQSAPSAAHALPASALARARPATC